jgi:hypothetical protein
MALPLMDRPDHSALYLSLIDEVTTISRTPSTDLTDRYGVSGEAQSEKKRW